MVVDLKKEEEGDMVVKVPHLSSPFCLSDSCLLITCFTSTVEIPLKGSEENLEFIYDPLP